MGSKVIDMVIEKHSRRIVGKTLAGIAIAVALKLFGSVETADAGSPEEIFQVLDKNGDGVVERFEFDVKKMEIFYIRDIEKDINLSIEETNLTPEAFRGADADGDGKLSGYEFIRASFTQFDSADGNTDGLISREEFQAFYWQFARR